jgi:hypothetical protein
MDPNTQLQHVLQGLDGSAGAGGSGAAGLRRSAAGRLASSSGAVSSEGIAQAADASPGALLQVELLDLTGLEPVEVTVANLQKVWAQQEQEAAAATATAAGPGVSQGSDPTPAAAAGEVGAAAAPDGPVPAGGGGDAASAGQPPPASQAPLKPIRYHLEWSDAEGEAAGLDCEVCEDAQLQAHSCMCMYGAFAP